MVKLGLNDDPSVQDEATWKDSGKKDGTGNDLNQHLTLSGKSAGAWSTPLPPFGRRWFLGLVPPMQMGHALITRWPYDGVPSGPGQVTLKSMWNTQISKGSGAKR